MDNVTRLLMQGAAGAGGDSTYVGDVFSTYLYKGNASERAINNGIKLGNSGFGNSVDFDGTANQLNIPDSDDWDLGNGDFTLETWVKSTQTTSGYFTALGPWTTHVQADGRDYSWCIRYASQDIGTGWSFFYSTTGQNYTTTMGADISDGQWHHIAVCRSGNNLRTFTDGVLNTTRTTTDTFYNSGTTMKIGGQSTSGNYFDGQLSNVRLVKGTALYTSNFTPPTKALTSVTNTKLLCCNQSTVTGATVTPGTITVSGGNPITSAGPFTASDGKGGMVWIKDRTNAYNHVLQDTERGAGATTKLASNLNADQGGGDNALQWSGYISAFNNNGFSLDKTGSGSINWANVNKNNDDYTSWSFRKQKGFFDIVSFTGNGSVRTISHSLGSVPGMIMIKNLSSVNSWFTYHRDLGPSSYVMLNHPNAENPSQSWFMNDTAPTATEFTLGTGGNVNANGDEFIAYLFAGGASTATGASSCSFNGTSGLDVAASSAVNFGTGTFCVEGWVYVDNLPGTGSPSYGRVFQLDGPTGNNSFSNLQITINASNNTLHAWATGGGNPVAIVGSKSLKNGQWNHIAVVRDSNNLITQYVNGIPDGTVTTATNFNPNSGSPRIRIGYYSSGNGVFDGKISNLRVTVGEPVYTTAFKPSTEPLTTTSQVTSSSNVKLLCCNVISNATGSTVTPGVIGNNGTNPVAYGNNPFDDPEGFKFGEGGDQNIVKCGSYLGNQNADGPEVHLGWEPQFIIFKPISGSENWGMFDCMRGIVTDYEDMRLLPNTTHAEITNFDGFSLTPTGFKITSSNALINPNGTGVVYIAIRRPDPLVGKPAEAGTDVFAQAYGANSGDFRFTSNFPVDFGWAKLYAGSGNWWTSARLIQGRELKINNQDAGQAGTNKVFDSNVAWHAPNADNTYISHMWKRHAGFDVVTFQGTADNPGPDYAHSLTQVPELKIIKRRNGNTDWITTGTIISQAMAGNNNSKDYYINLNEQAGATNFNDYWSGNDTSTHFTVRHGNSVSGGSDAPFLCLLFASVEGISKCGYYTGNGTSDADTQTITTGFQPRFIIIKDLSQNEHWTTFDTTRGWASGLSSPALELNNSDAQYTYMGDIGHPISTGFIIEEDYAPLNMNGHKYIYYAHA